MAVVNNMLQNVQTWQMSGLAYLQNQCCFISIANTRFKDFEKMEAQLGDTVGFEKPPQLISNDGLVVSFQSLVQRIQTLTVDMSKNVALDVTDQQLIFNNIEDYMNRLGKGALKQLGTTVEADVAKVAIQNTYRFFGDGRTAVNNVTQLAQMLSFFREIGAGAQETKGILANIAIPQIVSSGLNQYVTKRNEEYAMDWELGRYSECDWYSSNLLPIHMAGTVGNADTTLTVVSTVLDATGAVTAITFSGATALDPNAVLQYDQFAFQDGVGILPNARFLTFIGQVPTSAPVQFAASANAAADGAGNVIVQITPALQINAVSGQNINVPIVAGMTVKALPNHKAGLLYSDNALYLAMPALPNEVPFPSANMVDPDTGVAIRQYYGSLFGQNQRGMVWDTIWGKTLVPEYAMKIVFPL